MDFGAGDHFGGMSFTSYPREFVQPRIQPMEAMCLGLPRTGAMCMSISSFLHSLNSTNGAQLTIYDSSTAVCIALNKLGIRTYDMTECTRDTANGSTKRWLDGVEANYLNGQGSKIKNRRDLDDILYRYQVHTLLARGITRCNADQDWIEGSLEHAQRSLFGSVDPGLSKRQSYPYRDIARPVC